jgi:hypothetical protein
LSPPSSPYELKPSSIRSKRGGRREIDFTGSDSDSFAHTPSRRVESSIATKDRGMLLTPAKTPHKKTPRDVNSAARTLFAPRPATLEDAMPTPSKSRKNRKNVFTLESFADQIDEEDDGIKIYTDSKDRVPELDHGEDNPFVTRTEKGKGKAKARPTTRKTVRDTEIEEMQAAADRGEGIIYVL